MLIKGTKLACLMAVASIVGGCATIFTGSTQEVSLQSNPSGATVMIDGRIMGETPLTARIDKTTNRTLIVEKEGYKTFTTRMDTRMNPLFWGNIVIGGFLGSTTDAASGAVHEYSPSQFMISLERDDQGFEAVVVQDARRKAKDFIVVGYSSLVEDLHRGEGPHLASLLAMLSVPEDSRGDVVRKMKALSDVYTEIPVFADHVIDIAH
ncbi:MAG: PEGA domain-containing protein [Gammaproteobacteria bacterium]|nr:PEGA domain-containing protein [Gammaproteobacteria bacterium]